MHRVPPINQANDSIYHSMTQRIASIYNSRYNELHGTGQMFKHILITNKKIGVIALAMEELES